MPFSNIFKRTLKSSAGLAVVWLLAACAQPSPTPATPTHTLAPTHTPTPTYTPTPTFTPTPTAQPILIAGDLRSPMLTEPVAQPGAPCGVVDTLDFPLGPPDGTGYNARWIFGRYSDRYNGIHTGEDWVRDSGNSLGQPVYSIGHGMVTYAQPLGWGIDRGVVIVRHVFPDGSTFLSFYGHLDPPSVVLNAGDCVARGEQVGAVGKPRGRPHLHFEIRTRLPDAPGPGYWSVDPRLAGWKMPSDTIWNYRIQTSPGVAWLRPFTATNSVGLGLLSDGALAAVDGNRLLAIDPGDGSLHWSQPISTTQHALIDATGGAVYVASFSGAIQAFDTLGTLAWEGDLGAKGRSTLMPLPGGGVVAYLNRHLIGLSASGRQIWQTNLDAPPFAWTLQNDRLVFTSDGDPPMLYALDGSGQLSVLAPIGGRPVANGDHVFIYHPLGIYRLDSETHTAQLVLPLDTALWNSGDLIVLPDGSAVVSHRSPTDVRLIWLNVDGTLRWDRSVVDLGPRPPRLLAGDSGLYAVSDAGDVLSLDPLTGNALRLLDSGRSSRLDGDVWSLMTVSGEMLIDFRGGQIIALDPQAAFVAAGGTK